MQFDDAAAAEARARIDGLAKPMGSLARLEALAVQLAGIQGVASPAIVCPRVIVFAADHGVAWEEGVSAYPPSVTAAMIHTCVAGKAAVAVLARQAGASLEIVDVGVRGFEGEPRGITGVSFVRAPVAEGTANLATGPAMTAEQRDAAIAVGRAAAERAASNGVDALALGELGIGNTTAAAALVARLLGVSATEATGPGSGLDAEGVQRKAAVVQKALDRGGSSEPLEALADIGGLELAALVGCMTRAAELGLPVVLDGFIVGAAALVAVRARPELSRFLIPATRSAEPAHVATLEAIGAGEPLLTLGLRLGEASGAALALPLLRSSVRLLAEMATLQDVLDGNL